MLYGGATRFSSQTPEKLQRLALRALEQFMPTPEALQSRLSLQTLGAPPGSASSVDMTEAAHAQLAADIHERLVAKLKRAPLEDLRVDFEDGLGAVSDEEETALAARCGADLARVPPAFRPPFWGLRIRPVQEPTRQRALDTLRAFYAAYLAAGGTAPLVVTLPKVEATAPVDRFIGELEALERELGPGQPCHVELMVESATGLMRQGRLVVSDLVAAGRGRVSSVHLGSYDYAGSLGIAAPHQQPEHPAVELARQLLLLDLADSGVPVSDGALHQLPLPVVRKTERALTDDEEQANEDAMTAAWRRHAALVTQAMANGLYRGWDLHPHQLLSRYAATFLFFRRDLARLTERLAAFAHNAGQGVRTAGDWDDDASVRGLIQHFARGHACGAIDDDELAAAGLVVAAAAG